MDKHPIEGIMATTMENIRDMVDVNTVVGEAIVASDGSTVIPVSKVSFGFVAGGGEYDLHRRAEAQEKLPFAGGTGAGVTLQPMGFIVVSGGQVRLLPSQPYAPVDRIIEMAPQVLSQIKSALENCARKKQPSQTPPPPPPQQEAPPQA